MNNWKRNITLFLSSQSISLLGSSLVQYAMTWYITLTTQSGMMMTLSILIGFLPTFFITPFAGVWADRYNRKILIIISDSLTALVTLLLAILFFAGFKSIWLIFIVMCIRALGQGIQAPAIGAVFPQIIPFDKLTKLNAINGSVQSFIMLISPMISGFILTVTSIEVTFFIDVVTAIIAVAILIMMKIPLHEKAQSKQVSSYFSDLKEGFNYIINHKFIKTFCFFSIFFFILIAPVAFLTSLHVTRLFGNEVWRLSVLEICFSGGMVLGGILMFIWKGFKNKTVTMSFSNIICGFFSLALGITPIFFLYVFFIFILGFSMPIFNTPFSVLIQEKVEENYMGRVVGVLTMIQRIMMPMGMLVFGPLADYIDIKWILIICGSLIVIFSVWMGLNKTLLDAGKPKIETIQDTNNINS